MKTTPVDKNLFTQIGLDSGSLTMLGAVVHSFGEAGEYRGTVRKGAESAGVFYLSVDKNSPVAQADIDLAAIADSPPPTSEERDCYGHYRNRFSVNPKGYALFRVSRGAGGYDVLVRMAEEAEDTPVFDSRELSDGSVFSATILRPGTYSATNTLGESRAEIVVSYPMRKKTAYRPPAARRVRVTSERFYPERVKLSPAQGLLFDCEAPSRIRIELMKPDDGPRRKASSKT